MFLKVDSREKNMEILDLLSEHILFEVCPLTVGDYMWCNEDGSGVICIEHKSVNDFRSSLMSGHLDTQMRDLKQYPHYGLFISGDWRTVFVNGKYNSSFNRSSVKNKILSIGILHGVPVHEFKHPNEFVDAILALGEMESKSTGVMEVIRNTFTKNKQSPNYQMYSAMDGMGRVKIERLMKLYPCIFDFIDAWRDPSIPFPKSLINKRTSEFLRDVVDEGEKDICS